MLRNILSQLLFIKFNSRHVRTYDYKPFQLTQLSLTLWTNWTGIWMRFERRDKWVIRFSFGIWTAVYQPQLGTRGADPANVADEAGGRRGSGGLAGRPF